MEDLFYFVDADQRERDANLENLLNNNHVVIPTQGFFSVLTEDLMKEIFSHIDEEPSFAKAARVNHLWHKLATYSWQQSCRRRGFFEFEDFWMESGKKEWRWMLKSKTINATEIKEFHGVGFIISGTSRYEGDWVKGEKDGWGTLYEENYTARGHWKADKKDCYGVMTFKSGSRHEGFYSNGARNGKGKYYFHNGDIYDGDWHDNKKHGFGVYMFGEGENKGDRYEGEWKNDLKDGKGKFTWSSGDVYEGEYLNNFKHGKGRYTFGYGPWEGDNYDGEWQNDQKVGFGIYSWKTGDRYEGTWESDNKSGFGIYTYAHGGRYEGQFNNGVRGGHGKFTFSDGDWYEGTWANGSRTGVGVLHQVKSHTAIQQTWFEAPRANYAEKEPPKYPD